MKRSQVLPAVVLAVAVMAASVILGACSGGGGGGGSAQPTPKVQLSGTISSGYTPVAKASSLYFARVLSYLGIADLAYAAPVLPSVNEVIAIPIYSGSLSARNMPSSQTATIDVATGNFSLSLAKDSDWLLLLINSNLTGTSRFVGSVALNAGTDSMLGFPATDSTLTTMNLGTINRPGFNGDGLTTRTVGTTDFSLTTSQITAMAKTDKFFRNAMNIVNNYEQFGNGVGKYYQLRPDFHWEGSLPSLVTAGALSSAPSLTYKGMNFQLDQNTDSVSMTSVCNTTGIVTLHPPVSAGTVTMGFNAYSYANPIKNSGNGCSLWNGGPAVQTDYNGIYASNGYDHISFSVIDSFTSGTIPSGFWEWKESDEVKAAFDIANINPPITNTGQLKGFVPAYKITTDGNKKITRVDIAWYFYDSGIYTQLTTSDLKVLKHFVSGVEAKFEATVGPNRRTCEMYIDPSVETSFNPADPRYAATCQADANPLFRDWYYQDPSHPETNTGLMGFYETGGFGYFFDYFVAP
ncbi:MAG: hypothetical protein AABZ15_11515 [Nitrospirota bacterium]